MLAPVDSDPDHVMHINIFLVDMADFTEMNAAYAEKMDERCPACTAIAMTGLPKQGALLTMNLTAVNKV